MLKFKIYTFGCKSNRYDSAVLENMLCVHFEKAGKNEGPDVVFVNTCTVTKAADSQARQLLRKIRREHPKSKIVVFGCYSKVNPGALDDVRSADHVLQGFDPERIVQAIEKEFKIKIGQADDGSILKDFPGQTRAFLKIQDGCQSFCTYCIVPFARGRSRSMPPDKVIDQLDSFHKVGFKEVVLTGIHMGIYGLDIGTDLVSLLKRLEKGSPVKRLRLSSIEPDEVTDEMISLIADSKVFNHHLHLPLQSGDDYILKRMGRKYSGRYFHDLMLKIKKAMPDCGIGIDVIAGFPGEEDHNFTNTFDLINILPLSYMHVFPFSRRPMTKAFDLRETVDPGMIKERCRMLRDLCSLKKKEFRRSLIGTVHGVLIESKRDAETGLAKGLTRSYVPVAVKETGRKIFANTEIKVVIDKVEGETVLGKEYEKIHEKVAQRSRV